MFLPLKDENATVHTPWVTVTLLVVNAAAFVSELVAGPEAERLVAEFGFVPARLAEWIQAPVGLAEPATLLTAMFLHADLFHLGGNLLYLWIFGNNIEDVLGPGRFLTFYGLAGLGGHLGHFLTNASSSIPTIGASGAISGVLAAYLVLYPRARVLSLLFLVFFVRIIRVPAGLVIGIWLLSQVVGGVGQLGVVTGGGVAWFEHLGGFAAGFLLFPLLSRGARRPRR